MPAEAARDAEPRGDTSADEAAPPAAPARGAGRCGSSQGRLSRRPRSGWRAVPSPGAPAIHSGGPPITRLSRRPGIPGPPGGIRRLIVPRNPGRCARWCPGWSLRRAAARVRRLCGGRFAGWSGGGFGGRSPGQTAPGPSEVFGAMLAGIGIFLGVDRPVRAARGAVPGGTAPARLERLVLGPVIGGRANRRLRPALATAGPARAPGRVGRAGRSPPARTPDLDPEPSLRPEPSRPESCRLSAGRPRPQAAARFGSSGADGLPGSPGPARRPPASFGRAGVAYSVRRPGANPADGGHFGSKRPARPSGAHRPPGSPGSAVVPAGRRCPGGRPWPGAGTPA